MDFDDVTVRRTNWIYRRFFLSNLPLAPNLVCLNCSNGFAFGEIEFVNDEIQCQIIETHQSDLQINHLCWLSNTVCRPSKKQISYVFFYLLFVSHRLIIFYSVLDSRLYLTNKQH